MGHSQDDEQHSLCDNFNAYYLGWAILILVLLWLLIWAGAWYADKGHDHGMHGGAYMMDYSYSPGGKGHAYSPGGKWDY